MLPPGPTEPPSVQTMRWLLRPIAFLESCRRRFGDAFSVRFLGFQTPMVMLSDPDAIRALYGEREHGLPAGRAIALLPVVGPRSLLLLEGREHLARRRLMLPPFHGERMRAYESIVRDAVARDVEGWPDGRPFALHPRMQAITLDVILRAVFGVTDRGRRARAGGAPRRPAERHRVGRAAVPRAAVAPARRAGSARAPRRAQGGDRRAARSRRSPSGARTRATTSSRC